MRVQHAPHLCYGPLACSSAACLPPAVPVDPLQRLPLCCLDAHHSLVRNPTLPASPEAWTFSAALPGSGLLAVSSMTVPVPLRVLHAAGLPSVHVWLPPLDAGMQVRQDLPPRTRPLLRGRLPGGRGVHPVPHCHQQVHEAQDGAAPGEQAAAAGRTRLASNTWPQLVAAGVPSRQQ